VLEVLPVAPPLEPKMPSAAEMAVLEENDQRIVTLLKYRLGPILTELKRKFKRFTKRATVFVFFFGYRRCCFLIIFFGFGFGRRSIISMMRDWCLRWWKLLLML
jgi:hypothetical protein